jgi:hypothetical protein
MPGGRVGRSRPAAWPHGNVAAYKLYPRSTVYKLDGTESTAQFGGQNLTDASSKAELAKDGELKFLLVGNQDPGGGNGRIQLKDNWKLSQDRRSLSVERAVHSPRDSRISYFANGPLIQTRAPNKAAGIQDLMSAAEVACGAEP